MSLRLWVSACEIDTILDIYGCDADSIREAFALNLDEILGDDDPAFKQSVLEAGNLFIAGNRPEKEEPESMVDVCLAYVLARSTSVLWSDEEEEKEWAWGDLNEIMEACENRFPTQEGKDAFACLAFGRNLLGEGFEVEECRYGYLRLNDIEKLCAELDTISESMNAIIDSGELNKQDFDSNVPFSLGLICEDLKDAVQLQKDVFVYWS